MNVTDVLDRTARQRTLLIGFYGGGNYGDELLLEVLANLYRARGARNLTVAYQNPRGFGSFHASLGYRLTPMHDRKKMLGEFAGNDAIVIGGGGLWGLDVNRNVFLLCVMLFVARRLLGKKVYLIGVGYYSSTSRMGHLAAWLASKAANHIVARDQETFDGFCKYSRAVSLDSDIAWHLRDIDARTYKADAKALATVLKLDDSPLIISLRRFRGQAQTAYYDFVRDMLRSVAGRPVLLLMMEPRHVDPEGFAMLERWRAEHGNVRIADFSYNPVALYFVLASGKGRPFVVAPQFHVILTAHLAGIGFAPITYDNKVTQLLDQISPSGVRMKSEELSADEVLAYAGMAN